VFAECQTIRQKPFRQKGRIRFGKIAELLPNVPTDSAKVDSATTYEIIYKNTQEIPVTELVYLCLPSIKRIFQMISTNEEVNSPMEQGSNSLLERQMATLEDSERYNERPSAQPNSPMELTSFFARPVATQESSLPSLAQERSRDRSNRSINGIRKWHIEPAAGKRYRNSYQLL
jgi:hypothetical protein